MLSQSKHWVGFFSDLLAGRSARWAPPGRPWGRGRRPSDTPRRGAKWPRDVA
jgi:hypothetical protein